jgi:hypothetical protein
MAKASLRVSSFAAGKLPGRIVDFLGVRGVVLPLGEQEVALGEKLSALLRPSIQLRAGSAR